MGISKDSQQERLASDGIGVDVITGGFPCQDTSQVGHVWGAPKGTDGLRTGLWSELLAVLLSEVTTPIRSLGKRVTDLIGWRRRKMVWASSRMTWPRSGMTRNGIAYPACSRWRATTTGSGYGLLPTPAARDWKGAVRPETMAAKGRNPDTNSLPDAIEYRGEAGRLNPQFVEWLMGFPIDHTELDA